eukprot:gnl/TRDRNA2_/TRDRNA2_76340_c0_seq1.p1 gnl/TRDRNA2_/TRDRNA2_76340_c0~~gnl/TRDRNA2_/TRDRNA2_76340_c0_seq1.p1  ORF type:complete len:335 (-),score=26.54 gnl/TRDRNA2_/TRDRNA2_76340_c0_seq1:118-1008(-)
MPLAPAFIAFVVYLPSLQLGPFLLSVYTYPGLLLAAANATGALVICIAFRAPPREVAEVQDLEMPRPREILATVGRTGAYMSYFLSFQNNWNNQVLLWTIPIITAEFYPRIGMLGNSLIFCLGGIVGLATACLVTRVSAYVSDRRMILSTQLSVGIVLALFASLFGCDPTKLGGHAPPLWLLVTLAGIYWVPFIGQMPANNAIYSKLVGRRHRGLYNALLEMSKTFARAVSGYLIGATYATAGPCVLWGITGGIWLLQFLPFLANWSRLSTEQLALAAAATSPVASSCSPSTAARS